MLAYLETLIAFAVVMLGVSLIITILNQVMSAFLAHRGSNLRWGLQVLFQQIRPGDGGLPALTSLAPMLAETVLTHPLISDSLFSTLAAAWVIKFPRLLRLVRRWQFASAIGPDGIAAILSQIAAHRPPDMHQGVHAMLSAEIGELLKSPSTLAQRQGVLTSQVAAALPANLIDQAVGVVQGASGDLEAWFNRVMARVAQRFTMWMRVWTVVFSFAIAGGFCIDSFYLLRTLYTNGNVRSQLVSAAPQFTDIAKRVIPPGAKSQAEAVEGEVTRMYTDSLKSAAKDANIGAAVTNVSSSEEAMAWIDQNVPTAQQSAVRASFETYWKGQVSMHVDAVTQVYTLLSTSGLPKFGWRTWSEPGDFFGRFLGVLVTALLLSLGAPFWFNTLSSLTSLKPLLGAKQAAPSKS